MESLKPVKVYIGIGANWGRRLETMRQAMSLMRQFCDVTRSSPVYQSQSWGYTDSKPYLNAAIEASTSISPQIFLVHLRSIEIYLGRGKVDRQAGSGGYTGRLIDLDLLLYGDHTLESPRLTVPHPLIRNRRFVLQPLCDLDPELIHPIWNNSLADLLYDCSDPGLLDKKYENLD